MTAPRKHAPPVVSIGLPVYNGEAVIARAIESLLGQSFSEFELIISDNASTDATADICKSYAANDNRIKYVRQPSNIGPAGNFRFVLDHSVGEYFMWAADDDVRSPDFLQENLKILKNDPDCAFSSSPNCFEGDECDADNLQVFSLQGALYDRISAFIDNPWVSHACFYSLARRKYLARSSHLIGSYLAFDWTIDLHLLTKGSFKRTSGERLVLGRGGASQRSGFIASTRTKPIHYVVPFYDFSKFFVRTVTRSNSLSWSEKLRLLLKILQFNLSLPIAWSRAVFSCMFGTFMRKPHPKRAG